MTNTKLARRVPLLAPMLAILLATGCSTFREPIEDLVPLPVLRTLRDPESFEILALDPVEVRSRPPKDARVAPESDFHGYEIVGHAPLSGPPRRELVDLVLRGLQESDRHATAGPFRPSRGIRAVKEGRVLDVLLCYECSRVSFYSAELTEQHGHIELTTSESVLPGIALIYAEAGLPATAP